MKLLILLSVVLSAKVYADCHGYYKVDKAAHEAKVSYLVLEKNVPQKFCLTIPKGEKAKFIEFNSVNLGNASCSDVRMTVNPPGTSMKKLTSQGSQPGVIGAYKAGKWVVKLVLKDGCTKYSLGARWY